MALFNDWPFTNLHGINLTWVLEKVKEALEKADKAETDVAALEAYVKNYLENLNIDEKIQEQFNELIESGQLDEIIEEGIKEHLGLENVSGYSVAPFVDNFKEEDYINLFQNIELLQSGYFIGLWDSLALRYPDLITKTVHSFDDAGNPLVYYTYTPKYYDSITFDDLTNEYYRAYSNKPAILISSGIHGDEKDGIAGLYLAFKNMLENPKQHFSALNRKYYIMPVVNPSGVNANTYGNVNRVNINRNFPYNWQAGTDYAGNSYGETAGDQKETQFYIAVYELAKSNGLGLAESVVAFDIHNFSHYQYSSGVYRQVLWGGCNFINRHGVSNKMLDLFGKFKEWALTNYPFLQVSEGEVFTKFSSNIYGNGTCEAWLSSKGAFTSFVDTPINLQNNNIYRDKDTLRFCYVEVANIILLIASAALNVPIPYTYKRLNQLGLDETATLADIMNILPRYSDLEVFLPASSPILSDTSLYFGTTNGAVLKASRTFGNSQINLSIRNVQLDINSLQYEYIGKMYYINNAWSGPNWQRTAPAVMVNKLATEPRDPRSTEFMNIVNRAGEYSCTYGTADATSFELPEGASTGGALYAKRIAGIDSNNPGRYWYLYATGTNHWYAKTFSTQSAQAGAVWRRLDNV